MKPRYWSSHEYQRRSVKEDIKGFVGWTEIVELCSQFKRGKTRRNRALYSATFLTGGRISEVLSLKRENFLLRENEVEVRRMPLLKRYEKLEEWTEWVEEKPDNKLARLYKYDKEKGMFYRTRYKTKKTEEIRRNFSFPMDEPLAPLLVDWVKNREDYLFPGYDGHLSYIRAYQIFDKIGIYPHWLRGQRASCIISYYGWSMEEMMEWMGWEELTTARDYAKFGKKALKMTGITYPKKAEEMQEQLLT